MKVLMSTVAVSVALACVMAGQVGAVWGQAHTLIPGATHMASGLDARIGPNSKGWRAPVLDLQFTQGTTWVNPSNRSLIYSVPDSLSVLNMDTTNISIANSLLYSFEEYMETEVSAWGLSLGVFAGAFSAGVSVNHVSSYVHQKMSSNLTAMSKSFYGVDIFSLHNSLPAFLLPLSEGFKATIQALPKSLSDPNAQRILNDVVRTYGTHVVTSGVVGARLSADSFMSKSFVDKYTASQSLTECAAFFKWASAGISGGGGGHHAKLNVSATWKENSSSKVFFQGGNGNFQTVNTTAQWRKSIEAEPALTGGAVTMLSELVPDADQASLLRSTITTYLNTKALPLEKEPDFVPVVTPPTPSSQVVVPAAAAASTAKLIVVNTPVTTSTTVAAGTCSNYIEIVADISGTRNDGMGTYYLYAIITNNGAPVDGGSTSCAYNNPAAVGFQGTKSGGSGYGWWYGGTTERRFFITSVSTANVIGGTVCNSGYALGSATYTIICH